jgi:cell division protein ZapE
LSETPLSAYRALVRDGAIERDPAQELAAEKLNLLHRRLKTYRPPEARDGGGLLSRLGFGAAATAAAAAPQGLYLVGGVGRGKSMMMDLFFERAPVSAKRRVHFHAFMIDVHDRLGAARETIGGDPIPAVAKGLADRAWLLCFDEFQVNDPVDALILDRLFRALFDRGVVVVATSNLAPRDLYAGGLNRDRFLPFLELLEQRLDVLELDAGIDYRRGRMESMAVYFTPLGTRAAEALDAAYLKLTGDDPGEPGEIVLRGRSIAVPAAAGGVARFAFADLCDRPLGPGDYIAIAELYHTVVLSDVPRLTPEKRNQATRFVTLIDALYEHKVNLLCTAAGAPDELYPEGDGSFAFARTVSRLHEMQSDDYMAAPHLT